MAGNTEQKTTIHSDPKRMGFTVTSQRAHGFTFKVASLNFNNAAFQKDAGYDDSDFERRVMLLKKLVQSWAGSGVSIIHLQEISGRFMKLETLRHHLMCDLPDSWTTTGPVGRHGDPTKCLNLMTLWDASVFHIDGTKNFHFSEDPEGKAGNQLVPGLLATSNALITAFSPIVPSQEVEGAPHSGGKSVDTSAALVTVNCHLPLQGKLKVKCLERLFQYLDDTYPARRFGRILSGDMNLFEDEPESADMIRMFLQFGDTGCKWTPTGFTYDTQSGRKRQTTFLGMKHDLKNLMKRFDPDSEPEKFAVWCRGHASDIQKALGSAPWPLDWFLASRGSDLVRMLGCVVMEHEDLTKLDREVYARWLMSSGKMEPDFGNYLSDHLPLVATFLLPQ